MSRLLTPPSVAGKVFVYLTNEVGLVLNSNGDLQSTDSIKELIWVHGLGHILLLEELWTNSHLHLHSEEHPHPRPWRLKQLLPWKRSCNPWRGTPNREDEWAPQTDWHRSTRPATEAIIWSVIDWDRSVSPPGGRNGNSVNFCSFSNQDDGF